MAHPPKVFAFDNSDLWVTVTPLNHKLVEWKLNRNFEFAGSSLVFYVEFARATDGWERLNPDDPVINECFYVDTAPYRCALYNDVYYRVVAYDGIREYNSRPISTMGVLNKEDWLIVRDVIRKEYLRLKKYIGTPGYLMKRRNHGIKCPVCLEYDTGEVVNGSCPICYGTGVIGGYYNAVLYYLDQTGAVSRKDVQSPLGTVDNKSKTVRSVAYPRLDTYDLWVDGNKNKRYLFRQVSEEVALKGMPLIYVSRMHELPASSIEYQVPLEQDLSIYREPGDPVLTEAGWRTGITFTEI